MLRNGEVDLTVGREIGGHVTLVVLVHLITGESLEKRREVIDSDVRPVGDRAQRSLVGPHQRL